MAKISDSKIALIRPDFAASNQLLQSGMQALQEAPNPFIKAMENNFAARKDKAQGLLSQFINTRDTTAPGFNEEFQNFFDLVGGNQNNVSQMTIADDVTKRAPALLADNKARQSLADGELTQKATADGQLINQLYNRYLASNQTAEDEQAYYTDAARLGLSVNSAVPQAEQALNNAQVNAANTQVPLSTLSTIASLQGATGNNAAVIQRALSDLGTEVSSAKAGAAGFGGKGSSAGKLSTPATGYNAGGAGAPANSTVSERNSIINSLVGTESSGNSRALNVNRKDGKAYGGLIQMGDARLKDYARATGTKPVSARNFRNLSAAQQEAANNWHIDDLIKKAKASGGIGKIVHGTKMTLGGLVAVGHLGGGDNIKRFLKGNYNPSDELGTSLADYARKHGGSEAGGSVGSNIGYGQPDYSGINPANYSFGNQGIQRQDALNTVYNAGVISDTTGLAKNILGILKTPLARPGAGRPGQNTVLNESLKGLIINQADRDSQYTQDTTGNYIQTGGETQANIANNNAENQRVTLEMLAAEDAAAQEAVVGVSQVINDTDGFTKALAKEGISKEMFNSLPTAQQDSYIKNYQEYENKVKKNTTNANNVKLPGTLSTKRGDKINPKTGRPYASPLAVGVAQARNSLHKQIDRNFADEQFGETLGWDWLPGKSANQKKVNLKRATDEVGKQVSDILLSDGMRDSVEGLLTNKDVLDIHKTAWSGYVDYAKREHDSRDDLQGIVGEISNPRKLEELVQNSVRAKLLEKTAALEKARKTKAGELKHQGFNTITLRNIASQTIKGK